MATVSSQGSGSSISKPGTSEEAKLIKEATKHVPERHVSPMMNSDRYAIPDDGTYADHHIAKEVTFNSTTTNTDRFPEALDNTFAHPEGHGVAVTYFHMHRTSVIDKTTPVDMDTGMVHPSHKSYLKILGLELFIDRELEYNTSSSEDGSETTCEGTAITLPGFRPLKGDLFFMRIISGHVGVMHVTNVERMGNTTGTMHRISFVLTAYLTPEYQADLSRQITNTAVYDKTKYFSNKYVLLEHDEYQLLTRFRSLRTEIGNRYMQMYWDQIISSIMHPDGYFDPYVVAYLQSKLSIADVRRRPKQLYSRLYDYDSSIWYAYTESQRPSIDQVNYEWRINRFIPNYWSSDLTSLAGRPYVQLGLSDTPGVDNTHYGSVPPPPRDWYPGDKPRCGCSRSHEHPLPDDTGCGQNEPYGGRSISFYIGDVSKMSTFENHLFNTMHGDVNAAGIMTSVMNYNEWDRTKAFYDIPFALALIDAAIFKLGSE